MTCRAEARERMAAASPAGTSMDRSTCYSPTRERRKRRRSADEGKLICRPVNLEAPMAHLSAAVHFKPLWICLILRKQIWAKNTDGRVVSIWPATEAAGIFVSPRKSVREQEKKKTKRRRQSRGPKTDPVRRQTKETGRERKPRRGLEE